MWRASVILTRANLTEAVDYRCIRCGNLMFKINRDILALWMGQEFPARLIPLGMGWIEHRCKNCRFTYSVYFQ